MKTVLRILILAVIAGGIYFLTIGKDDFYDLLEAFSEVFQAVADNYLKK